MATVTSEHYRAYTPRPFTRQERDTVTILFGGLHWRAERIVQAVLEAGTPQALEQAARELAKELFEKVKRPWMIYAVDGEGHDALVEVYPPQPAAPGADKYAKKIARWQRREAAKGRDFNRS